MEISIHPLVPEQIPFLHQGNTLFILDYRALWESFDYEIPSMWKYENLAPWILKEQTILVNQNSSLLYYENNNNLVTINTWDSAKISLIERAEKSWILQNISFDRIFAFIPHPAIDEFCQKYNKKLSYTYKDFVILNDKIQQKKAVTYTPKRHLIKDFNELQAIPDKHNFYVKRGIWSGWFTVFKLDTLEWNEKFRDLLNTSDERYLEEKEYGECMSIQLCKTDNECVVFWLTKQYIKEEKEFCWAEIININILSKNSFLREKLHTCISNLCEKLLSSYTGFFGIDFIYDEQNQTFWFLEWNIRLTAMTIPTLIHNKNSLQHIFKEDIDKESLKESDLILWYDTAYECCDVLTYT